MLLLLLLLLPNYKKKIRDSFNKSYISLKLFLTKLSDLYKYNWDLVNNFFSIRKKLCQIYVHLVLPKNIFIIIIIQPIPSIVE